MPKKTTSTSARADATSSKLRAAKPGRRKTTTAKKAPRRAPGGQRVFEAPTYKAFRFSKRIKHPKPALPKARVLLWGSVKLLCRNWKLMGGILLVYFILSVLLVRGWAGSALGASDIKGYLESLFTGVFGKIVIDLSVFSMLLVNIGSAGSEVSGVYATVMLVVMSLVIIWALRQIWSGTKVTVKDAFYKSLYQLVPFLLVLAVVGIQLLPIVADNYLYGFAIKQGVLVTGLEKALVFMLFGLMALWSFYMISASMMALYIVALPDVRPMEALRAAKKLVTFRRWTVMRKVMFLPVALLLWGSILMAPIILLLPVAAEWVFFVLSIIAIALIHTYMYSLYRELIK